MIFECGPDGADQQVCVALAQRLVPGISVSAVTLDNKPNLIRECGRAAASLRADRCDPVLIIWDLYPAWRERGIRPCRSEDRTAIHASLTSAGVAAAAVGLVCIQEELEAWLLADGRALSTVLSRPTHAVRITDTKNPDRTSNPKKALDRLFQRRGGYSDRQHAIQIVRALPDFNRLRRIYSFQRFCGFLGAVI